LPLHVLLALAATTATPVKEPSAAKSPPAASAHAKAKPAVDPMEAIATMLKLFDKFFPAGPEPEPARLALARQATMTMFPRGAFAQAMTGFVNRTADRVLDMSEADFAAMVPPAKGSKAKKPKSPSTEPLRVTLAKKEPNFDAKLAAIRAFAGTMFVKFGDVAEPKFREGMARALARKFDARQLAEIQAFLATPTGAAYGREMVGLWFEPDVIRGTFEVFPELMKMAPDLAKDGAALDARMKAVSGTATDKQTRIER
jgi:hypothetical protein